VTTKLNAGGGVGERVSVGVTVAVAVAVVVGAGVLVKVGGGVLVEEAAWGGSIGFGVQAASSHNKRRRIETRLTFQFQ
jgi:hypothetical protein